MERTNEGATRSLDQPEQHMTKGGVEIDVVRLGDITVKRATYPPGWVFSKSMGADKCYDTHVGYTVSGHMSADLDDGRRLDFGPGSVFIIPPGHDGRVEGDEPCVIVQFDEGESAAQRFNVRGLSKAA